MSSTTTAHPPVTIDGHARRSRGRAAASAVATELRRISSGRGTTTAIAIGCLVAAAYLHVAAQDAGHVERANRLGSAGRYSAALAEAARVSHQPAQARAALVEAYALLGAGRPVSAAAAFARAARQDPNNWVIHRDWGLVLLRLGRTDAARSELAQAVGLNPLMQLPPGVSPSAIGAQ